MNLFEVLWDRKWALRSILSTIYFNFKCLPLSQAWKLPVILYIPHFQKLSCVSKVEIRENTTIGWDCIITDSDFHRMTKVDGGYTKGYGEIHIGKNNWLAAKCIVLKNTRTPDYCSISASTTLNKDYSALGNNIVIGNKSEVEILRTGVYLNPYNDK